MRNKSRGFTLIEILVVMVIIGIVAALVAQRIARGTDDAKRKLTRTTIASVATSIQQYSLDNGHPPETLDDLIRKPASAARWDGPYVDVKELLDAWGQKLVFRKPGATREFDLLSYGGDGKPGGEGSHAADVAIW